jgi:hypothetical protein
MLDWSVPNFRRLMRSGAVVMNDCRLVNNTVKRSGGGVYHATRPGRISDVSGSGSLTTFYTTLLGASTKPIPTINLTDLEWEAMNRALANVDKAPYSVAEDAATIRQTLNYLRNPVRSFYNLAKQFERDLKGLHSMYKRGNRRRPRLALISDLWLEHRFAFSPTVRSISNVISSLEGADRAHGSIKSAHGVATRPQAIARDEVLVSQFTFRRESTNTAECKATVLYTSASPLREWQYKYGLRAKDVPELMWDLFPYSFMIDRVVDIGSAIRGFTNLIDPSVKILSGCVTLKQTTSASISCIKQVASGWTISISPDTDTYENFVYDRKKWTPTFANVIPPVLPGGLIRDATSIADLLSLGLQKLR